MMNNMTDIVKGIEITPVKAKKGLVGFASFEFIELAYVGCIAIYTSPLSPDGFRLVYPTKVLKNNTQVSIFHPISKKAGDAIQKCVVSKYLEVVEDLMKGG